MYESNLTSLYILNSSFPYYNITDEIDLYCCYKVITRKKPKPSEYDFWYQTSDCTRLPASMNMEHEYVRVHCFNHVIKIYDDIFWFVLSKVDKVQKVAIKPQLNVLIIGMDSCSRSNLHRQMPKTLKYLQELNFIELMGYNKVEINTYPNLVPLLTGRSAANLHGDSDNVDFHFDNCTFLWNLYKEKGYMTSFGEDSSWMGIFNLQRKGFINQPTDYYYSFYNRVAESLLGNNKLTNILQCIGGRDGYKDFINYITALVKRLRIDNMPYFAFHWGSGLSHDYVNKPSIGDEFYREFFRNLHVNGYLNDTVLMFMSDHGFRWGGITKTYVGKMEDRLPFMLIGLPDWFKKKFSQAYYNLNENVHRLTTHYDIHATLMDILNLDQLTDDQVRKQPQSYNQEISLFSKIPLNRTCLSAGIPSKWCACQTKVSISTKGIILQQAALFAVDSINDFLKYYRQCAKLQLDEILTVNTYIHDEHVMVNDKEQLDYGIVFRTEPGGCIFEATVKYIKLDKFEIIGNIKRINNDNNNNNSVCVNDLQVVRFCVCKYD